MLGSAYRGAEDDNLHGFDHVMVRDKIRMELIRLKIQRPLKSFVYLTLKDLGGRQHN